MRTQSLAILLCCPVLACANTELTWEVTMESRWFTQDAAQRHQPNSQYSLTFEPEYYLGWNNDADSLTFKPFLRLDNHDSERRHADIRELIWVHVQGDWELHLGIGKVFWGVAESQHLVDVINQTDAVEAIDGEDKLGQPMIKYSLSKDWGVLDAYLLPGFRERTFASRDGRLRTTLPVDVDNPQYQSSREQHHLDWAIRWSQTLGDWDVGLAYFDGTNRDPLLRPAQGRQGPVLIPYYEQMQQLSSDLQATLGDTLWKVEAIYRESDSDDFLAFTGGFEHTLVGIRDSAVDLGLLAEYQFDERDELATTPGQNDLFVGARIALNDAQSTEILFGITQDLDDSNSHSALVEASRRVSDFVTLSIDAWIFQSEDPRDILYSVRRDDFIQLNIEMYF